jgi:hypothetical protein
LLTSASLPEASEFGESGASMAAKPSMGERRGRTDASMASDTAAGLQ